MTSLYTIFLHREYHLEEEEEEGRGLLTPEMACTPCLINDRDRVGGKGDLGSSEMLDNTYQSV